MRALCATEGSLVFAERDIPEPGPDEIVIKVEAAGLNNADTLARRGRYPTGKGGILGLECAGSVAAVGARVTSFAVGEPVMALARGGHAEYVAVDAGSVLPRFEGLTPVEAGGFMEAACTAFDALVTQAGMAQGSAVLVQGASGGVGVMALQLARNVCAPCTAVTRHREHREALEAFGATVIEEGSALHGGFDIVLEAATGAHLLTDLEALSPHGTVQVIAAGNAPSELDLRLLMGKGATIRGSTLSGRSDAERALVVSALASARSTAVREIAVPVAATFPFSEAEAAYDAFSRGGKLGKIVLVMDV